GRSRRWRDALSTARARLAAVGRRYGLREWPRVLAERRGDVLRAADRLTVAAVDGLHARRLRLLGYEDRLRALAPMRVMERGYCLVRRRDGTLLRVADEVAVGDAITVEFARGQADARVEAVHPEDGHGRE